jgi:hypothetical protein
MPHLNQNIVIPDNTIVVNSHEFSDPKITYVNIGQSVKISADYMFARCNQILELNISSGTILSGYGAFYCSNGLRTLTICDNVTLSGSYLFKECTSLESLTIGHSTIISGNHCLNHLKNLQRIQFAPNTTFSGYYLLCECNSIREVIIPDNCTISGNLFFRKCSQLERIVIGNNVVITGNQCFYECSGVKSITIGNNVTILGLQFMEGCFVNQNIEMTIGLNYVGYPIEIPIPLLKIKKFKNIKDTLRYEAKECTISMEKFEDESEVIILECGHVFLLEPLLKWLKIKENCAICRQNI